MRSEEPRDEELDRERITLIQTKTEEEGTSGKLKTRTVELTSDTNEEEGKKKPNVISAGS